MSMHLCVRKRACVYKFSVRVTKTIAWSPLIFLIVYCWSQLSDSTIFRSYVGDALKPGIQNNRISEIVDLAYFYPLLVLHWLDFVVIEHNCKGRTAVKQLMLSNPQGNSHKNLIK